MIQLGSPFAPGENTVDLQVDIDPLTNYKLETFQGQGKWFPKKFLRSTYDLIYRMCQPNVYIGELSAQETLHLIQKSRNFKIEILSPS